ncbi:hypothetical protein [Microvirga subterranea]|uniref:Uncharacterized protein n=1 Tax=Microvirga subterranea TaxID=186651 RepID=A0A370HL20_9HYPH|nr:hypothetical protein [Microvirga subterranea]RDI56408.1 hypothetical protein DES45_10992 [Microvirga subterranea]
MDHVTHEAAVEPRAIPEAKAPLAGRRSRADAPAVSTLPPSAPPAC